MNLKSIKFAAPSDVKLVCYKRKCNVLRERIFKRNLSLKTWHFTTLGLKVEMEAESTRLVRKRKVTEALNNESTELRKATEEYNKETMELRKATEELNKETMELRKATEELIKATTELRKAMVEVKGEEALKKIDNARVAMALERIELEKAYNKWEDVD